MQPLQPSNKCWQTIATKLLIEASFSTLARGLDVVFDAIRRPSRMMQALRESRRFAVLVRPSKDGPCSSLDDAICNSSPIRPLSHRSL